MRAVIDNDRYLCVMIPTIKRRNLSDYEKITCKSCSYGDSEFSCLQLQLQQVYIHLNLDWEKSSLLVTTENTTQVFSAFLNKNTCSHTQGSSAGTTPVLLTWKVPFLCFWRDQSGAFNGLWWKIPSHWCFHLELSSLRSEFPFFSQTLP